MRTGTWLVVLAVGGILTFAVRTNTSAFNFQVAGLVIMAIAIIALLIPQRGRTWLGRRMYVRRTRHLPDGEVEEGSYPPYVVQNPGTSRGRAGLPPELSIPPHSRVAAWTNPKGNRQPGDDFRDSGPPGMGPGGGAYRGGAYRGGAYRGGTYRGGPSRSGTSRGSGPRGGGAERGAAPGSAPGKTETPQQMEIIEDIYEE